MRVLMLSRVHFFFSSCRRFLNNAPPRTMNSARTMKSIHLYNDPAPKKCLRQGSGLSCPLPVPVARSHAYHAASLSESNSEGARRMLRSPASSPEVRIGLHPVESAVEE